MERILVLRGWQGAFWKQIPPYTFVRFVAHGFCGGGGGGGGGRGQAVTGTVTRFIAENFASLSGSFRFGESVVVGVATDVERAVLEVADCVFSKIHVVVEIAFLVAGEGVNEADVAGVVVVVVAVVVVVVAVVVAVAVVDVAIVDIVAVVVVVAVVDVVVVVVAVVDVAGDVVGIFEVVVNVVVAGVVAIIVV